MGTNEIQELRQRIISHLTLLEAFNGQLARNSIRSLVLHHDDQKRQGLLTWLSPLDYGAQQSGFSARRQPGTGLWLLDSPEFQAWIAGSKQPLSSQVVPALGKQLWPLVWLKSSAIVMGMTAALVSHIYPTNFQCHHEQGIEQLLVGLLRQLAQVQPAPPSILLKMYDKRRSKSTRPPDRRALPGCDFHRPNRGIFKSVRLDECNMSSRLYSNLLDTIFNLQALCDVNFLATSRFIPKITERFKEMPTLEIRADKEDVARYLRENLSILPSVVSRRQDLQEEISNPITSSVDGM